MTIARTLRVSEIFPSINGEVTSSYQGSLCTFIRLSGCLLKCSFCDTLRAQDLESGQEMTFKEILLKIKELGNSNITITGGEPLLQQRNLNKLITAIYDQNSHHYISIETNGSIPIPEEWPVCWVADWKGPSSGERDKMSIKNFKYLLGIDFIKFVIVNREDFDDAMMIVKSIFNKNSYSPKFAFSACMGVKNAATPKQIIEWMQQEPKLKEEGAIFNLQIHKIIDIQ